jgi:exopolyphosphatase/guanosine-5'-triphosphate,3'-diphosphate pyrophosphatase
LIIPILFPFIIRTLFLFLAGVEIIKLIAMELVRRAVIDVGTNSVKLLVAEVTGREVRPMLEESRQTRLGKDFYETRILQPEAVARTAGAVASLAGHARALNPASLRVIATSAARDAQNAGDLTAAIQTATGLTTEIISGGQEAEWSFQGVTTDPRLAEEPLLILDVGGGSTEMILGCGRRQELARSFPLGTIRLLEQFPPADPPSTTDHTVCRDWVRAFLRDQVRPQLAPAWPAETAIGSVQLVGTGGTAALLGRMERPADHFDREAIESVRLSLDQLTTRRAGLWSMTMAQRQNIPGLPPSRADVILTGVVIYEAVMEVFGFQQLSISTRGLRFAAVMQAG